MLPLWGQARFNFRMRDHPTVSLGAFKLDCGSRSSTEARTSSTNSGTTLWGSYPSQKMRLDNRARSVFLVQEVTHINQWRARDSELLVESHAPMSGYAPLTRQALAFSSHFGGVLLFYSKVITTFPRACPSSRYRIASGTSLKL